MKAILTRLTWGPKGISGYNGKGFQFRLEQPWMIELMNRAIVQGLVAIDQEKKRRETYAGTTKPVPDVSRGGEDIGARVAAGGADDQAGCAADRDVVREEVAP